MAKPTVDLELKKAFLELHVKEIETSKKISDIDAEISTLTRVQNQVRINGLGIAYLPEGTKTYEAVGRIFLRSDLAKLKQNLAEREVELAALIKEQNDNKKYLEKTLKESEDNIREMVRLKKIQPTTN